MPISLVLMALRAKALWCPKSTGSAHRRSAFGVSSLSHRDNACWSLASVVVLQRDGLRMCQKVEQVERQLSPLRERYVPCSDLSFTLVGFCLLAMFCECCCVTWQVCVCAAICVNFIEHSQAEAELGRVSCRHMLLARLQGKYSSRTCCKPILCGGLNCALLPHCRDFVFPFNKPFGSYTVSAITAEPI